MCGNTEEGKSQMLMVCRLSQLWHWTKNKSFSWSGDRWTELRCDLLKSRSANQNQPKHNDSHKLYETKTQSITVNQSHVRVVSGDESGAAEAKRFDRRRLLANTEEKLAHSYQSWSSASEPVSVGQHKYQRWAWCQRFDLLSENQRLSCFCRINAIRRWKFICELQLENEPASSTEENQRKESDLRV